MVWLRTGGWERDEKKETVDLVADFAREVEYG